LRVPGRNRRKTLKKTSLDGARVRGQDRSRRNKSVADARSPIRAMTVSAWFIVLQKSATQSVRPDDGAEDCPSTRRTISTLLHTLMLLVPP